MTLAQIQVHDLWRSYITPEHITSRKNALRF